MDQIRGFAMFLVVSVHSEAIVTPLIPDTPFILSAMSDFFSPFRMPLLMFLSGIWLSRSLSKSTGVYFLGKLRSIAWPYLVWSVIFLLVSADLTLGAMVHVFILPPTYLWYLWFLIAFYISAWVMVKLRIPTWIGTIVGFAGAFGPDNFRISRFFFLFVFFTGGHLYNQNKTRIPLVRFRAWLFPVAILFVSVAGVASSLGVDIRYRPLFILAPLAGITLCLLVAPRLRPSRATATISFIGRNSLVFYVTHFSAIWLTSRGLISLGFSEPWLIVISCSVLALAIGCGAAWLRHNSPVAAFFFEFPHPRPTR